MAYMFKKEGRYIIAAKHKGKWVRQSTGFKRESDAKKVLRRVENRLAEGVSPFEQHSKRGASLDSFAQEYLRSKEDRGFNIERDTQCLAHLKKNLPVTMADITRGSIEAYIGIRLKAKAHPATVWTEVKCLKSVLAKAILLDRLTTNPAKGVTVKDGTTPRRREPLDKYELGCLLEAAEGVSGTIRDLIETALLTGMRRGELLALREQDCNMDRKEIQVLVTKTGNPRVVPMHPQVWSILGRRGKWHRETAKDRLFPIVNTQRPFQAAVKKAGLTNLRFHDLRRLAISYLCMAGVDVRTTMALVGHRDPRMTLVVYSQVSNKHMQDSIAKIDLGTPSEHEVQLGGNGSGVVRLQK